MDFNVTSEPVMGLKISLSVHIAWRWKAEVGMSRGPDKMMSDQVLPARAQQRDYIEFYLRRML
jgi:hypothetical protein